jgi:2-methylcitrate dehydratase PrpD
MPAHAEATATRGISEALATWAAGVRFETLPAEVVAAARSMLFDSLGVAVRGAISPEATFAAEAVAEQSGPAARFEPGRGQGRRLASLDGFAPRDAAFVNGTAAMALELDDGYSPGGVHPSPPVLPAALAVCDATRATTRDDGEDAFAAFLTAYIVGCEVVCRVAAAAHPASLDRGFHITPVAGVIGAAVASALAAGDDEEGVLHAMGIAGSFAGGLFEFVADGASVKRIHAGHAAASGMLAATLARRGLTGPRSVLEGANGLLEAFAGRRGQAASVVDDLGDTWRVLDRYTKLYPCARHSHAPVDLVLEILEADNHHAAADIERIVIETYGTATKLAFVGASTELDAQMSMPYAVAAAAVHGRLGLDEFDAASRQRTDVLALAERIEVMADADLDAHYPQRRPARVTVAYTDGTAVTRQAEGARGEPYLPVTEDDLDRKFRALTGGVVGAERAAAAAGRLREVATWGAFDEAMTLLAVDDPS